MSETFEQAWSEVEDALDTATGIAFDGCHKIYIMLDQEQYDQMVAYGYGEDGSHLIPSLTAEGQLAARRPRMSGDEMLATLKKWYEDSCPLKFVSAVETVDGDPNDGFTNLIPQFFEEEAEDEDDLCPDCGDASYFNSGLCYTCGTYSEDEDEDEDE